MLLLCRTTYYLIFPEFCFFKYFQGFWYRNKNSPVGTWKSNSLPFYDGQEGSYGKLHFQKLMWHCVQHIIEKTRWKSGKNHFALQNIVHNFVGDNAIDEKTWRLVLLPCFRHQISTKKLYIFAAKIECKIS